LQPLNVISAIVSGNITLPNFTLDINIEDMQLKIIKTVHIFPASSADTPLKMRFSIINGKNAPKPPHQRHFDI
jgi:hypothetical protein